jgi:hypothetical protein
MWKDMVKANWMRASSNAVKPVMTRLPKDGQSSLTLGPRAQLRRVPA